MLYRIRFDVIEREGEMKILSIRFEFPKIMRWDIFFLILTTQVILSIG